MPKQPPPLGKCALCLESAVLQNSHIIPEWLYKPLYDQKHQFTEVSTTPGKRNVERQKGLREHLLCYQCEQQLSGYEDYGVRALHGQKGVTAYREQAELRFEHLDYKKFKLLQLSILWRASVSTKTSFHGVKLGPHQEVLRRMIHAEDPGPSHKYGCVMIIPRYEGDVVEDLMAMPTEAKLEGQTVWRFVFAGMVWSYAVSNRRPSQIICDQFLQEDGRAIMRYGDLTKLEFIMDTAKHLVRLGKLT